MDSLLSNGSCLEKDGGGLKVSSSDNVNCASLEESYSLSLSDVDSLLTSSSNTADEHSLDSLKFEVTRLRIALSQEQNEKLKAAQHGLDLLEEKENICKSYNNLQKDYDQLKNELTITQQSLDQKLHSERQIREISREDEDAIEREKAEREIALSDTVAQLKVELKKSQESVYHLQQELERLSGRERELCDTYKGSEMERVGLKGSVRDLRERERKLNQDILGLEEENVHLQQQVSHLRMRQIENDRLTGERDRLEEKSVELSRENEELAQMKETFKSYYEKAIEALNSEKELRKKVVVELEKTKQMQAIQYVPYPDRTGGGTENFSCEEDSMNSDLESLLNNQNNSDSLEASASMGVTSLQDELRQLDPNIGDKIDLNRFGMLPADIEQDDDLTSAGSPSTPRHSRVPSSSQGSTPDQSPQKSIRSPQHTLSDANQDPQSRLTHQLTSSGESRDMSGNGYEEIEMLRKRNQMLTQEINQLRQSLLNGRISSENKEKNYQEEQDVSSHFESALKHELEGVKTNLTQTKEKLKECERRLGGLEDEHRAVVSCSYATLDEVALFSEEISSLQHIISPQQEDGDARTPVDTEGTPKQSLKPKVDELIRTLQSEQFRDKSKFDTEFPIELISLVQKQLRELKRSCQRAVTSSTNISTEKEIRKEILTQEANENSLSNDTSETQTDLGPQVEKLKSELAKKREQITSLRAVLKANKHTAEVALTTVKTRYEQDKQLIVENVSKLKNELNKLKNDSATFAYIRTMLVSRVDALTNQFEAKNKECRDMNESVKTLEQILRMAISQKLALTERLEALESGVSPDQSTSSKSANGSQKTPTPRGQMRGFSASSNNPKSLIPQRYAKNPRASDQNYLKKAYLQNK